MRLPLLLAAFLLCTAFLIALADADQLTFHGWATHGGTITGDGYAVTTHTGNDPNYHWNKSSWAGRTGQKAFLSTSEFNGMKVSAIESIAYDVTSGYWGNAYFNIMVEDAGGAKAIIAPSWNSATSSGFDPSDPSLKYAVFEAEPGWTATPTTGFNAATWDDIKDLTIVDGPFTEFPDTLNGDATMQNDPVYQESNWADWAGLTGDPLWADDGFMITFGQSTGPGANPADTILEDLSIGFNGLNFEYGGESPDEIIIQFEAQQEVVPEPATLALWGVVGSLGLLGYRRRNTR